MERWLLEQLLLKPFCLDYIQSRQDRKSTAGLSPQRDEQSFAGTRERYSLRRDTELDRCHEKSVMMPSNRIPSPEPDYIPTLCYPRNDRLPALTIVIQSHTHCPAMVSIVLPYHTLAGQLPQPSIVVAACCNQVRGVCAERTIPHPSLMLL